MRKILFGIFLIACAQVSFAQSALKGKVTDTLEKKNLENAVVYLLRKSDSTLYKFSRTDRNGEFHLANVRAGKYLLMITYPKFADYADEVEVSADKDFGMIPLIQASALLENVVVRQNIAIRLKGDTIEYKADSFKVAEGASVKELLRKLPGLQVDSKGQITAQGQKVEKVLVDGEEFFSDDPAVVIENLRADAIDKVQSYDKKSDQAEFTGVDDGSRSKTLNLVLKDDKKKGFLGKIVVGGGTTERYSEEAMLNFFKGKKKFSVYGIASNTGRTGLGWEDRGKFGAGDDFGDAEVEMGAGFIMIMGDGDNDFSDWDNTYYDEGIPRTIKAGAHASNKWNADKQNANGNYSLKDMRVNAVGNSLRKFLLTDTSYYSRENHNSLSQQTQQLFNGIYDVKLDSNASLKFKFNGKLEHKKSTVITHSSTETEEQLPVNTNYRNNNGTNDNQVFLGSVLWRQKFKKKGRTVSLSASYKTTDRSSEGFLYSETDYYNGLVIFDRDTIDQYKTSDYKANTTTAKLVYTEPAGKKGLIEFNYTFNRTTSTSDRRSYDENNGKYELLNKLFSNRYSLNYSTNSAGAKYQYNGKKLTANIGTNVGVADYRQKDSLGREVRHFQYTNLFPTSRISYRFAAQRSVTLNYSGTPQPPGVEQIQPIRENTNPLFITVGNPNLQQAFRHNISLFFTDFKMLTGRSIWINGGVSPVQKAIVNSTSFDRVKGITTSQYINASGNYNYWFYGSYGLKLKKLDLYLGLNLNSNGSRYVNFIDGIRNRNLQNQVGASLNGGKYKEDKYDFNFNLGFNYNRQSSSTNPQKNIFWSQEHNARMNVALNKRLWLGSEANVYIREKTDAFVGNNNIAVWDADLSYKFFKKKNGVLKLEVKDILKQRRGYERRFESNSYYERSYNMLGRYAMLSFIWNFTKNPAETK